MRTGELRTKIIIKAPSEQTRDTNGYPITTYTTVFDGYCKWEADRGGEDSKALVTELTEQADVTMRYYGVVTPRCTVFRGENEYKIISAIEIIDERNAWIKYRVSRRTDG